MNRIKKHTPSLGLNRETRFRVLWWRATTVLSLATAALAAASCGNSDPIGPTDAEWVEVLLGEWDWESATGGIAGTTRTPASEGFTMRLVIEAQGRIEVFRNDSLLVSTTYQFVPAQDLGDKFLDPKLTYTDPVFGFGEHRVGLDGSRLLLTDPCCDGFVYRWLPR